MLAYRVMIPGMAYETEPTEASEALQVNENRPPVNPNHPPHVFVPSEFPEGRARGRCDLCGGGAAHEIHQIRVDPLVRIADAAEQIAALAPQLARIAEALENISENFDAFLTEQGRAGWEAEPEVEPRLK